MGASLYRGLGEGVLLTFTPPPSASLPTSHICVFPLGPAGVSVGPLEIPLSSLTGSLHLSPEPEPGCHPGLPTLAPLLTLVPSPTPLSPKYLPNPSPMAKTLSLPTEGCGPSQCPNH